MSKLTAFALSFLLFFDFFGCTALRVKFAEKAGLEMMQSVIVNPVYDEGGDLLTCQFELHWDGREYEMFVFADLTDSEIVGKLFGLTDHSGSDLVYLAVGQKPEEWLIWSMAQPMGIFVLYKEKSVMDIPDAFASLKAG